MKTPIVACLQTRLEHFARKLIKRRNKGKFSYQQQKHRFIKREIDSMNDCFEFMEEPLYGFRVNITQEIQCSKLGPNCGIPSNSTIKGGLLSESCSIWLQFTEDGRSTSIVLVCWQTSQGRIANYLAFIDSKSFDL